LLIILGPALSLASAMAHHWASSLPPLGDPLYSFYLIYILMKKKIESEQSGH